MLLLPDGAAQTAAKLVVADLAARQAGAVAKCVVRIECVVAKEFVGRSVEPVGASPGDDMDLASHGAAEFGLRRGRYHRELLDSLVGWFKVDDHVFG